MLAYLLLSLLALRSVSGYPNGAPVNIPKVCEEMSPFGHNATVQSSKAPFVIQVDNTTFEGEQTLTVTVKIDGDTFGVDKKENYYEGLFVQARPKGDKVESTSFGTFATTDADLKAVKCFDKEKSAISHSAKAHYKEKTFTWTAPKSGNKNFVFYATIVHETDTFWTGVESPLISFGGTDTSGAEVKYVAGGAVLLLLTTFILQIIA